MAKADLDRQLLGLFIREVQERSGELERMLLAVEGAAGADERRHLLERLLRIAHSLKGAAGLVEIRSIEKVCHRMEDLLAQLARAERPLERADLDVLLEATDWIAQTGGKLEREPGAPMTPTEDVLERLDARLGEKPKAPQDTRAAGGVPMPPVRTSDLDGSIRLSGHRLDALLYRSGELLAAKSRLSLRAAEAASLRERFRRVRFPHTANGEAAPSLDESLRELAAGLSEDARLIGSLVGALDHEIRRARMQRFAEACQGLSRLVRDIGNASGKLAELNILGGEIEVDRSIVSGLQDSLRHLVRNAMGHGIETPPERRKAGKPEKGRITVSAALFRDRFQVHVEDDGRGFDLKSIAEAAAGKGLPEAQDERQLLRRAFEPGISTSAELTSLSGRGVGLDIVRNAVEAMRGTVELSNVRGGGAAFTMTLPLTLATVRALEVMSGGQIFTIDTSSVRRVGQISTRDLPERGKPNLLKTANGDVRVLDLATWLGFPGPLMPDGKDIRTAVFVGTAGDETAVLVEQILEEQEMLVRSLGPRLANTRCYSGATILPDGRIALLLNAAALIEAAASGEYSGTDAYSLQVRQARKKILVVDDSPSVRALEKLILEGAGYDVAIAADGAEAWKHLRTHGADVVVADIDMPEMDGVALTQTIRRSRKFAQLPVILISGRDTVEEKEQGLHAGANAYMAKSSFDQQLFLEAVRQMV